MPQTETDLDPQMPIEDNPGEEGEHIALVATAADHAQRLDKVLSAHIPSVSRSFLTQLVNQEAVKIGGVTVTKAAQKVRVGDCIDVHMRPTQQAMAFTAQDVPLDVLFEDEHIAIINKPAGLVVHPGAGNWSATLLNGLLHRYANAVTLPRGGIVHRLDKDTSGLMVVARSRTAFDALVKQLAARDVSRVYLAIAQGDWRRINGDLPTNDPVTLNQAIGRDVRNRLRMGVVAPDNVYGKPARTDVFGLDACVVGGVATSLLRCKLHTGRTHQIRVHLSALGYPLVGDGIYGGKPIDGLARQALHAHELGLVHPNNGQTMHWSCPPPPDLQHALTTLGLNYNKSLFHPTD
ncbi:MAG: RluA family pseudouridine synthase [Burkholderiaceae bacterium]|jgi:23S rRNA pseudouridine1911/1915/1917 synthase|nr:RluA family pseudouridine synthase [Burkholderiaceae bacterium]